MVQLLLGVKTRFIQRQTLVRKSCSLRERPSLSPNIWQTVTSHLMVNDKHQFIYCQVPKTGVTSWKSALLVLMGKEKLADEATNVNVRSRYRYLSSYPEGQRQWRLKNYTKFMVHRDPMRRLVSAYIDKFATPDTNGIFHEWYGRRIISMYRPGASKESLKTGLGVTFEEFVRYVLDGHMNPHWIPATEHCEPCLTDYDYYAATETAEEDSSFIFRAIGASDSLHLPHLNANIQPVDTMKYYSELSSQMVEKILKLYEEDFLSFGYKTPDVDSLTRLSDSV